MTSTPPRPPGAGSKITPARIAVWIVVGGIGIFMLVSGIVGIVAKG